MSNPELSELEELFDKWEAERPKSWVEYANHVHVMDQAFKNIAADIQKELLYGRPEEK